MATAHLSHKTGKTGKPKKTRKLNIKRLAIVAAAFCFTVYCAYVLIWQQVTISEKNSEIASLEAQIDTAKQETEKLQTELENTNDPAYIEQMAREKLGLVRPNERVFVDANQSD